MNNKIKNIISILLVFSMVFSSSGFYSFASSFDIENLTTESISANYNETESTENIDTNIEETNNLEDDNQTVESTIENIEESIGNTSAVYDSTEEEYFNEEADDNDTEELLDIESELSPENFIIDENENNNFEYDEEPEEDIETVSLEVDGVVENNNTNESVLDIETDTEVIETTIDEELSTEEDTTSNTVVSNTEDYIEIEIATESDTIEDEIVYNFEEEIETVATLSNINTNEKYTDLISLLNRYNIQTADENILEYLYNLDLQETEECLLAEIQGYVFVIDQQFVDYYLSRLSSNNYLETNLSTEDEEEELVLFGDGSFDIFSDVQNDEPIIFGAGDNVSITLDFGEHNPRIADSNNWNGISGLSTGQTITFTGPKGASIYATLKSQYGDSVPKQTYGSGEHAVLPKFDANKWAGFRFDGWYDESGYNLNSSQQGTFFYSFQYENNLTYTASWVKDTTKTQKLNIKYYREKDSVKYNLVNEYNEDLSIDTYIYKDAPEIIGYTITSKVISIVPRDDSSFSDLGANCLKIKDFNGNYIDFPDNMTLDGNVLNGRIPNHDIFIEYYYTPDTTQTILVNVNYYSAGSFETLRVNDMTYHQVESLVNITPASIDNYEFASCSITTPQDEDLSIGKTALGTFHTEGECFSNEDVKAANGQFKALMPNQEINIDYFYKIDSTLQQEFKVVTEIQREDGTYDVSTVSTMVYLGEDNKYDVAIENKEDQGYGVPAININNFSIDSYSYDEGNLKYYIDTISGEHILTITYGIDYTSDYWTKLSFNSLQDAHGSIQAAENSKPLTERYIARNNTYDLEDLIANIDINADQYYRCVWYKNRTSGIGPTGDPLPESGIEITTQNFNLFASFEEDPNFWVDIKFENATNSTITGTTTYHLLKDTQVNTITLPVVHLDVGYEHRNSEWLDETGAVLGNTFTQSHTYKPNVVSKFAGSTEAVKPVGYVTYDSDGQGKIMLLGVYDGRKYILTDKDNKILQIKNSTEALLGFNFLQQGTTYHLYEALSTAIIPNVGETIATAMPNISEKYLFGIRALNNNYNYNQSSSTLTINGRSNIVYALLDDRYNIVSNWTNNPTFNNLTNGTYYLVVAKNSSDYTAEDSDDAIRNGCVVYTLSNDLSQRKYRLIIYGNTAYAQNAGSGNPIAGGKYYEVPAGTQVTYRSSNGNKSRCVTNNVDINENDLSKVFSMPNQDVVITSYNSTDTDMNKINIYNNDLNMSIIDTESVKSVLNQDTAIAQAINDSVPLSHNIVINRYATNKTQVQSLGDGNGKVSPYEYTIDVQNIVLGKPYPNSKISDANYKVALALDNSMIANNSYAISNGSMTCPYNPQDQKEIGLETFSLTNDTPTSINYIKSHQVNVKCTIADIQYDNNFYVTNGSKIDTATNYDDLEDRMQDIFDNGSNDTAKEYIYNNITIDGNEFDVSNTNINGPKNLVLNYTLNEDRENIKLLLSQEITNSRDKHSTLSYNDVKDDLLNEIQDATNIRTNQKNYTVEQLTEAKTTLENAKNNANDPTWIINLSTTEGSLSSPSITVTLGDAHTYDVLANITGQREGYVLTSFNLSEDGTGTTINATDTVGQSAPDTLYAVWEEQSVNPDVDPSTNPTNPVVYGGGSTGGGGGGGGMTTTTKLLTNVAPLVNIQNLGINYANNKIQGATAFFKSNSSIVYETENIGLFYTIDNKTFKMNMRIGDKTSLTPYKSQWVTVFSKDSSSRTYRTDEDGNVLTGKYVDDNNIVYYLNEDAGTEYGVVKTGWIYDNKNKYWYYANPINGSIVTGWQTIDGKDYCFFNSNETVTNGKSEKDTKNRNLYGAMMYNIFTPDGFLLGSDGARIEDKPYNLTTSYN